MTQGSALFDVPENPAPITEDAQRLLAAFYVLAQNFFQRENILVDEFALFIQRYCADAIALVLEPCHFSSDSVIDAARGIVEPIDPTSLKLLSGHLDAALMESIQQDAYRQFYF